MNYPIKFMVTAVCGICFTVMGNSLQEDMLKAQSNLEKAMIERISNETQNKKALGKTIQNLTTITASNCYANIQSSTYPFQWLIFTGGWYWELNDTSYAAFYDIMQYYRNYSTYNAFFHLMIYTTSTTPSAAAQVGITVANSYSATIYINQGADSIGVPKISAIRNSYAYNSGGNWSVDDWYFFYKGTTYQYRIFTTVSDWNTTSKESLVHVNNIVDKGESA